MTVDKFIEEYNNASDKEKFVKKHIVNAYVPYAIKIDDCTKITDASCYAESATGVREFKRNSVLQYFLFIQALVQRYTDIEFGESPVGDIDTLTASDVLDEIVNKIPAKEYMSYKTILEMVVNDLSDYEHDFIRHIRTELFTLTELIKPLINDIAEGQ